MQTLTFMPRPTQATATLLTTLPSILSPTALALPSPILPFYHFLPSIPPSIPSSIPLHHHAGADAHAEAFVTKFDFVEWLRTHKPRDGPWASTAKIQKHFGLNKVLLYSHLSMATTSTKLRVCVASLLFISFFFFLGFHHDHRVDLCP
jgi:hypothetical protein